MKHFLFPSGLLLIFITGCGGPSRNDLFSEFPEGTSKEYSVIGVSAFYDKDIMSPDDKMFHVYLIKGKEMLSPSININPINENIIFNGRYFDFDPNQLRRLNKKYPIDYSVELMEFSTQTECDHFLLEHQNDTSLLCFKNLTSGYNGEATVYISSEDVMIWRKGIDLIKSITDSITVDDRECSISYLPTDNEGERYQYTIHSSKLIYNRIKHNKIDKQEWLQNKKKLLVYWNNNINSTNN